MHLIQRSSKRFKREDKFRHGLSIINYHKFTKNYDPCNMFGCMDRFFWEESGNNQYKLCYYLPVAHEASRNGISMSH